MIEWEPDAVKQAQALAGVDRNGMIAVYEAITSLVDDPRPRSSSALGSEQQRRLHIGRYRVMYAILDHQIRVTRLGRV